MPWWCSNCARLVGEAPSEHRHEDSGARHAPPVAQLVSSASAVSRAGAKELVKTLSCQVENEPGAVWLYDGEHDEFLVVLFKNGKTVWAPRRFVRFEPENFIDARKLAKKFKKDHETYPGELGVDGAKQTDEEEEDDA